MPSKTKRPNQRKVLIKNIKRQKGLQWFYMMQLQMKKWDPDKGECMVENLAYQVIIKTDDGLKMDYIGGTVEVHFL